MSSDDQAARGRHDIPPGSTPLGRRYVLIVDNQSCDGWIWAGALRRAGYRVALAADTDAGWHALDSDDYTLLIISQNTTGRTGLELIRKVRSIPGSLPCILVWETRAPDPLDVARFIAPGMTLEKPVTIPRLLGAVRTLLEAPDAPPDPHLVPRVPEDPQTHAPAAKATPPLSHILVAEDDVTLLTLLEKSLCEAGYRVTTAADGESAWEILCRGDIDLLLTDLHMPRLSGLELLRRVRLGPLHLPVVLMSGQLPSNKAELHALLSPGITLSKPFALLDLHAELALLLAPQSLPWRDPDAPGTADLDTAAEPANPKSE